MKQCLTVCLSLFIWLLVVCSGAHAGVMAGPIVNPANSHTYYLLSPDYWTNSEAEAIGLGGHLVTINDAAENQWVLDKFSRYYAVPRSLWIGFNDVANEGTFVWSSGENSTYRNWYRGEPNNSGGIEHYAMMYENNFYAYSGKWNDLRNDSTSEHTGVSLYGVVEVNPVPVPAAVWLLGSGLLGLVGFRRKFKK